VKKHQFPVSIVISVLLSGRKQIASQLSQLVNVESTVMIGIGLIELGSHISHEFFPGDRPIVVRVHDGHPLPGSGQIAWGVLAGSSGDAQNRSQQEAGTDHPRKLSIVFHKAPPRRKGGRCMASYITAETNYDPSPQPIGRTALKILQKRLNKTT
jgi:hypothetical protein